MEQNDGNAVQLFHADGNPSGIWYCSECRAVHKDQRGAQSCHGVTHCEDCGVTLGKRQPYYKTHCDECGNQRWRARIAKEEFDRYTKAQKVPASEYSGPQVYFADRYYETVEDAIDGCEEAPEYVWAAKNVGVRKASIEDLIERVLEEAWEDADADDLNGIDELQRAVDAFNAANASTPVFMVDYSTAIVIGEEILAEWKKGKDSQV